MSEKQYDVVFTIGVFDMLHAGHVELFERMRELADQVVVLVHDDLSTWQNKKKFPVQRLGHRKDLVGNFVDMAMSVRAADPSGRIRQVFGPEGLIGMRGKSVAFMRGDDWKDFPGRKALAELGIMVLFKKYKKGVSSTRRRMKICKSRT